MSETYSIRMDLKIDTEFAFGEIWKVRDELIRLLPNDRIEGKRNFHRCRTVIIAQNCLENNDEESLMIEIAPLSSTIEYLQKFDVLLFPDEEGIKKDGVKRKCMAQIQLSQPILKKDLFEKVGEISQEKKEEIAAIKLNLLGIDLNNTIETNDNISDLIDNSIPLSM